MRTRRALVMAPVLPEFDRESGSRRIFDLLMFLCEAGWSVTFVAQRGAGGTDMVMGCAPAREGRVWGVGGQLRYRIVGHHRPA